MPRDRNSSGNAIIPAYPNTLLHIGGRWRPGSAPGLDVVNPATGDVIGKVENAAAAELDDALAAASSAFAVWRRTSPRERAGIMRRAASLLAERANAIAPLLTIEQGKPLQQAHNEISSAVEIIHWFAEEATRAYGRLIPARASDVAQDVVREPVGPVAAFTPWNFPINQSVLKLAAALAAGCSIIMKGPEETPASCAELVRAFADAGAPDGVVNLVYGVPPFISGHLISHPVIQKVSFTGSTAVGRTLAQLAGKHLKRITLELGGHAPALVLDDADVDEAAQVLARAKYYNAGQVCIAPTRLLVHHAVFDRFVAAFESELRAIKTGYGLDPGVTMGPLANERRLAAMRAFVEDAAEHGAEIQGGGHRIGVRGNFFEPTLVLGAPIGCRLQSEEPFGPIALVNRVNDYAQAVAEANRLPYGLAAYAFTRSAKTMNDLARDMEAGMLSINHHGLALPETPFGGVKESGYGTEGGSEGIDAYMTPKLVSKRFV
jgi:succinate-semialdehyde dehydrogenase/glutarate-semialdehyde dehydrogenase